MCVFVGKKGGRGGGGGGVGASVSAEIPGCDIIDRISSNQIHSYVLLSLVVRKI